LAPGFNVIPETKFNLSGGLGFGYIFWFDIIIRLWYNEMIRNIA
jgi:hypothetical protein